jgi:hypothetical protein
VPFDANSSTALVDAVNHHRREAVDETLEAPPATRKRAQSDGGAGSRAPIWSSPRMYEEGATRAAMKWRGWGEEDLFFTDEGSPRVVEVVREQCVASAAARTTRRLAPGRPNDSSTSVPDYIDASSARSARTSSLEASIIYRTLLHR